MQAPSGLHAFYNLLKMITQPKNIKFELAQIALIYVKSRWEAGSGVLVGMAICRAFQAEPA
jgi:hypothetical protein